MRRSVTAVLIAFAIVAAGCGGGGGKGKGGSQLVSSVAETRARYQVLDLATRTVTPVGAIPDLTTNPAYRTTKIAFRIVSTGSGALGGSGALDGEGDEAARSPSIQHFYLAAFECTQAQWTALGGGTPWTGLASYVDGALSANDVRVGATYPAIGVAYDDAVTALAGYNVGHAWKLRLPNENEWERACRAGSTGAFSWGDTLAQATVTANARVWETAANVRGAATVGSLAPNAWGFYDMHGNVWELCSGGIARGGSWNDPISYARCANRAAVISGSTSTPAFETDLPHLLVGVRLVYMP